MYEYLLKHELGSLVEVWEIVWDALAHWGLEIGHIREIVVALTAGILSPKWNVNSYVIFCFFFQFLCLLFFLKKAFLDLI